MARSVREGSVPWLDMASSLIALRKELEVMLSRWGEGRRIPKTLKYTLTLED